MQRKFGRFPKPLYLADYSFPRSSVSQLQRRPTESKPSTSITCSRCRVTLYLLGQGAITPLNDCREETDPWLPGAEIGRKSGRVVSRTKPSSTCTCRTLASISYEYLCVGIHQSMLSYMMSDGEKYCSSLSVQMSRGKCTFHAPANREHNQSMHKKMRPRKLGLQVQLLNGRISVHPRLENRAFVSRCKSKYHDYAVISPRKPNNLLSPRGLWSHQSDLIVVLSSSL